MPKPSAIKPGGVSAEYVRLLLYADPGTGKSAFAGTAPKALYLKMDPNVNPAFLVGGSTADVWAIETWKDLHEARDYIINEGHREYEWVVGDSLTLFQEKGLDDVMMSKVKANPERRKRELRDKAEYGENMTRIRLLIKDLSRVPMHMLWTAHRMIGEDKEGNDIFVPMIHGLNMPEYVASWMNIVAHYEVTGEDEWTMTVKRDEENAYMVKDGYDALGTSIVFSKGDKQVPMIMKAIEQRVGGMAARSAVVRKAAPAKAVAAKKAAGPVKKASPVKAAAKKG
jgi:hypothetical protein